MEQTVTKIFTPLFGASPTGWEDSKRTLIGFWTSASTAGIKDICVMDQHFLKGVKPGPCYAATKWWLGQHGGYMTGYLKDAYVVYGLNSDYDPAVQTRVLIGNRYYYRSSYEASNDMLIYVDTNRSVAIMLPGETV